MSEVITGITPSAPRRAFGAGVMYLLGATLAYVAVTQATSAAYGFVLICIGAVAIYGGWRMWQETGRTIELTEEELRLSDGTVICKVADLEKVDRSFFAFKPSNGFLLITKTRHPYSWSPGLWWRIGKRIGVGGVTPAAQGKFMADTIAAMIADRDGLLDDFKLK